MEEYLIVQVISDIHMELSASIPKIPPKAKYLFLCGDISNINDPNFISFF